MRNPSAITWLAVAAGASALALVIWLVKSPGDHRPPPMVSWRQAAGGDPQAGLYVDERLCAECHPGHAADHAKSGHASTFHLAGDHAITRQLDGMSFADPQRSYRYQYSLDEQQDLWVSIPELFGEERFPLEYSLGSGENAVTLLTLAPTRLGDTVGVEHRVTVYRDEPEWELDLTPGHAAETPRQEIEHFGKLIQGDDLTRCIACHTTSGRVVGQEIVGLRANVGCQSCHGPGREHLTAVETGGRGGYHGFTERTAREEVQLCGRCHRLPSEDAGAPAAPDDIRNVRFQPVGLLQSRCFTETAGGLKCSTCHNPHQRVSRKSAHYVQKCLTCHSGPQNHVCPVSPRTDCVRCHMPPVDIHRGIEFHDHWIRVRPERTGIANQE
jgi:hypothetical protein